MPQNRALDRGSAMGQSEVLCVLPQRREGWDSGCLRPRPHMLPVRPPSGKKLGFTIDNGKLHNVSLGQGQEVVAEDALDMAAEMGHWVILQVRGPRRLPHHVPCARSAGRRAVVV